MNQHVRELLPPPGHSARATPEFAWERFGQVARELPPLFKRHWAEASVFQGALTLSPNWQAMYDYDLVGLLRVFTVRSNTVLVGYAFLLLGPSLNYSDTRFGQLERIWLEPSYREGWRGYHMVKEVIRYAKEIGVEVLSAGHMAKDDSALPTLFKRAGFRLTELVYTKDLRDA